MKKLNANTISNIGVLSYIILTTIGYLTTTASSRALIESVRILAAISVVLIVVMRLLKGRVESSQMLGAGVLVITLFIGFLTALTIGAINSAVDRILIDWIVLAVGLLLFDMSRANVIQISIAKSILVYGFIGLIVTLLLGGLTFSPLPGFNYEYIAQLEDVEFAYSLGMSNFMALIAIVAMYLSGMKSLRYVKFSYIVFGILFLTLSFLAGGRGDSLAGLVVIGVYILYRYGINKFISGMVVCGFLFIGLSSISSFEDLLIVQRFNITDDVTSGRDILVNQSVELLINKPVCMFMGCGFAFFQNYYSYEYGMYPHNIILEAIITFGAPFVIIFALFVWRGLIKYVKQAGGVDLFVLLFFYNFLIALKSNAMSANWLLVVALCMFCTNGLLGNRKIH